MRPLLSLRLSPLLIDPTIEASEESQLGPTTCQCKSRRGSQNAREVGERRLRGIDTPTFEAGARRRLDSAEPRVVEE